MTDEQEIILHELKNIKTVLLSLETTLALASSVLESNKKRVAKVEKDVDANFNNPDE